MKKWITGLLTVLIVFFSAVYIIIPGEIAVSVTSSLKCPEAASVRLLSDTANWKKWWPQKKNLTNLSYNGYQYSPSKIMYNAYEILQVNKGDTIKSNIVLQSNGADSVIIKWGSLIKTSKNPFTRIGEYLETKKMEQNMSDILAGFNAFVKKQGNIYGFNIQLITLKDTSLISAKLAGKVYPSTTTIYGLIKGLKTYIIESGAKEVNYPMLNVRVTDSGYLTMVAIPVDKELKGNRTLSPKRMPIVKDNTLLIEVHGGPLTIQKAFAELANYMQDHQYGAPAIPFELLVTDRSKETDTTKWVTKIYAPIM